MANFNFISPVYDGLARMVFGSSLEEATRHFLGFIQAHDRILIMGGGNGRILNWIDSLGIPVEVTYLESSTRMISNSMSKGPFDFLEVDFNQADARTFMPSIQFDAILTPFFLDCFTDEDLSALKENWVPILRQGGVWIFTDFVHGSQWEGLIPIMYFFFRITAGLHVQRLPNYSRLLDADAFHLEERAAFVSGLVESRIYRKL
jgi:hypothetical protein